MQVIVLMLRSKSIALTLGSAIASALNLYSFLIFPAFSSIENMENFVRQNYLGGLYMSLVVASVAPLSIYVFTVGKKFALSRYLNLSLLAFIVIGIFGFGLAQIPWSYICLVAAFFLQAAGFFQAAFIRQERIAVASCLVIFQPFVFAALITMQEFNWIYAEHWASLYLVSCVACVALFASFTDWSWMREVLYTESTVSNSLVSILLRMSISVSFPLFFQLELILFGQFGQFDLGIYAMLQKLYSSISISLFGSVGLLLMNRSVNEGSNSTASINQSVLFMALASSFCVLPIGVYLVYMGRSIEINVFQIALSAIVAFLFTITSFVHLRLIVARPILALKLLVLSFVFYGLIFVYYMPIFPESYLVCAGSFFVFYLISFYCMHYFENL